MYIEIILTINFLIDYILFFMVSIIMKDKINFKRLILGSSLGEISLMYLYIDNVLIIYFLKFITSILLIIIVFGYKNIKEFIKYLILFYILSFFLGGVIYYIKLNTQINGLLILLLSPLILNIYYYFTYKLKSEIKEKYKVSIYLNNGNILYLKGYMDTANTLIEPYYKKKVIIINEYVNENFFLVPYETIDNSSLIRCFCPKKVYIDTIGERNDVVVGIINKKFKGYDCLLNYLLMENI